MGIQLTTGCAQGVVASEAKRLRANGHCQLAQLFYLGGDYNSAPANAASRDRAFNAVACRILAIHADLLGADRLPTSNDAHLKARVRKLRGRVSEPPSGVDKPKQQVTRTRSYFRDPAVCAYVLERAKGRCEACGQPAPFIKADGDPFLEVHHVVHLAERGPDTIDNAIAACPNCHRRLHHSEDRHAYRLIVWERCSCLERQRTPSSAAP